MTSNHSLTLVIIRHVPSSFEIVLSISFSFPRVLCAYVSSETKTTVQFTGGKKDKMLIE